MANGDDFYNLTSGQIAGAPGGGENLESIIRNLYGALVDKEKFGDVGGTDIEKRESFSDFGFDWMTGEEGGFETGTWGEGTLGSRGTGEGAFQNPEYNLENLLAQLEGMYGEEGTFSESTEQKHTGMKSLYNILQDLDIGGLAKGYRQDVSDIGSEFGAKFSDLTSQYTGKKAKKGRYSSLMGGGRPKSTTEDYLSQYYGTKETEQELYTGEREELVSDYDERLIDLLANY
jgi:hypothetical protein